MVSDAPGPYPVPRPVPMIVNEGGCGDCPNRRALSDPPHPSLLLFTRLQPPPQSLCIHRQLSLQSAKG